MTLSAFSAVLIYTWPVSGASAVIDCAHSPHWPRITPSAFQYLTAAQVRVRYPAYQARCTVCGQMTQIFASLEHCMAGGWHQQGGTSA